MVVHAPIVRIDLIAGLLINVALLILDDTLEARP